MRWTRSAGLAVSGLLAAGGAELRQLETIRRVAPVLLGDVVARLAVDTRHGDLGTHVRALARHGSPLSSGWRARRRTSWVPVLGGCGLCTPVVTGVVPRAGIEPDRKSTRLNSSHVK